MNDRDSRRRFSRRERAALLIFAEGRCTHCGAELPLSFHADHLEPWAQGGRTDVVNGQALCETCNLRKGDRPDPNTPETGSHQADLHTVMALAVAADGRHPSAPESGGICRGQRAPECQREIP
jgi:hypothetical protein